MYKIKTLNAISATGTDMFDPESYAISGDAENPDAILVRSAKMHDMQFGQELLCIARAGAGTNNIPVERCGEEGIVVFNTPGANSDAVKELVLCSMLISSRDVLGGIDWVKSIADKGDDVPALVESGKNAFVGPELLGKTLGVIGLGAIGAKIANDAVQLGMQVYGYDPYLSIDSAWRLSSLVKNAKDLAVIYKNCDYITIHVPYMDSTHHFINKEALDQMKVDVRIINLARAELVDDDAILEAIDSGKVSHYVTDFPNAKTVGHPGVIAIPHLGASTPESEDKCAYMAAKQMIDYIENGNIVNSVNMPYVVIPRTGREPRVCVIHKNIPEMITKISSVISSRGINIENMMNAAARKSDLAYTVIDVSHVTDDLKAAFESVEAVIRVRVLR